VRRAPDHDWDVSLGRSRNSGSLCSRTMASKSGSSRSGRESSSVIMGYWPHHPALDVGLPTAPILTRPGTWSPTSPCPPCPWPSESIETRLVSSRISSGSRARTSVSPAVAPGVPAIRDYREEDPLSQVLNQWRDERFCRMQPAITSHPSRD